MTLIHTRLNKQFSIKQQRLSRSGPFNRRIVGRSFCPPSPSRTTTTYTTGARAEIVTRPSVGGGGTYWWMNMLERVADKVGGGNADGAGNV